MDVCHKWIPETITYGHWMANNIFFYWPLLIVGSIGYQLAGEKALFLGIGILIWGIINSLDHIGYSIIDHKVSPGLFTGFIYLVIAMIGLFSVYATGDLTVIIFLEGIISGLIYAFLPIILSIVFHKIFKKIFI